MFSANTNYRANQVVNGLEAVTLFSRQSSDALPAVGWPVPRARRKPLTDEQRAMSGLADIRVQALIWQVWNVGLYDNANAVYYIPKFGDRVQDQFGVNWEVRQVDHKALKNRYDCMCIEDK